jgi:1-acyl-sn-glycerol-3-phosphate acyltransferase
LLQSLRAMKLASSHCRLVLLGAVFALSLNQDNSTMAVKTWTALPPLEQWKPSGLARSLYGTVERIGAALRVDIEGLENIPKGRALLVANHAFGWDVLFVMSHVFRERGRPLWVLGEHLFWRIPGLRTLARELNTVDGSRENLEQLLAHEQWVLVLPGGLREAVKPRELRYRLLWGERYGFIRAAIRQQAPIIPVAAIGADEIFDFVGDAYGRGRRWLGLERFPIPLPARLLPWPRRVPLRYVIGQALTPPAGPERADDELTVRRFRHEVAGALHELIDVALARRAGLQNM